MARTTNIISGVSLALALTLAGATMAAAQPMTGSDYENGRILPAATAVRVPAGYHVAPTTGDDLVNGTVALPAGAKGAAALTGQSLGDTGQQYGPRIGSDFENGR
jgi:hypothetical protein